MARPVDALRAQGVGQAYYVKQVPAAAFVAPLAAVGLDEVAPKQVAGKFVVKTDGVVAYADGAWLAEFGMYAGCKFVLGQAVLQAVLRGDACNEARLGIGQVVGRGLAQQVDGLANGVEVGIGADGGKLRGAVGARVGAKGFVIVPEKGVRSGGAGVGRIHARNYGLSSSTVVCLQAIWLACALGRSSSAAV